MSNEELYEKLVDKMHYALEEVILDLDNRNNKEFDVVNEKIDDICFVLKDLVKVLNELV
ncbi:MAG TPA: hypothetical protein GXX63_02195 [Tissierellia bacterium]|nr:hypothetical protein [Tissierellia bacterium]